MEGLNALQISVNLFLQSLGLWLAAPMKVISTFGQEEFYMVLLTILYWCIDAGVGARVGAILLLSNSFNGFFKMLLHTPRPFWINSQVKALASETSFGLPSNHAQTSVAVWGLIGKYNHQKSSWIAILILLGLIGLSRLYLGVHFLSDVLIGWLIGLVLILVFAWVEPKITNWAKRQTLAVDISLAAASSIFLIALNFAAASTGKGFILPEAWSSNFYLAFPATGLTPFAVSDFFTTGGTWFGLVVGVAWLWKKHGGFCAAGTANQKIMRYVIGLVGVFLFWYGLGAIFPRSEDWISYLLRYFRYALVGFWVAALAPLMFVKLKIAELNDHR